MSDLGLTTIAQLLFMSELSLDFAKTVAELESVLSRFQTDRVRIAWDCDDYVCFDIPGTRIQLAWSAVERRGYGACLTISVGPGEPASPRFHEDMCSRLVDRIQTRFDAVAVMWCQTEDDVCSDVIDDLLDTLPHLGIVLPEVQVLPEVKVLPEIRRLPDIENLVIAMFRQEAVWPLTRPRQRGPSLQAHPHATMPPAASPVFPTQASAR